MALASIPKRVKLLMLLFGLFASAMGVSEIVYFLSRAAIGSVVDVVYAAFWVMFLVVYWIAYFEKPFGKPTFWKMFVPALIIADISSILLSDLSEGMEVYVLGVIVSLVLSIPLYLALWWYAFTFIPSAQKGGRS